MKIEDFEIESPRFRLNTYLHIRSRCLIEISETGMNKNSITSEEWFKDLLDRRKTLFYGLESKAKNYAKTNELEFNKKYFAMIDRSPSFIIIFIFCDREHFELVKKELGIFELHKS